MSKLLKILFILLLASPSYARDYDGFVGFKADNSSTGSSALVGMRMVNDADNTMGVYLTGSGYDGSTSETGIIDVEKLFIDVPMIVLPYLKDCDILGTNKLGIVVCKQAAIPYYILLESDDKLLLESGDDARLE